MSAADPHAGAALYRAGADPAAARLGLVLVHGRGGSAADILGLTGLLKADDIAALAPEAQGNSWWPVSFLAPIEALEPWLTSALATVDRAVAAFETAGLPRERIIVGGFSQGACLALEWAARNGPVRFVTALSGGLVGTADAPGRPDAALYGYTPKGLDYWAQMAGMPVYLSCHQSDPHIPLARVRQTADVLGRLGAKVDLRLHPGAGHGVTEADLAAFRALAG